jgi:hypothetical protein
MSVEIANEPHAFRDTEKRMLSVCLWVSGETGPMTSIMLASARTVCLRLRDRVELISVA